MKTSQIQSEQSLYDEAMKPKDIDFSGEELKRVRESRGLSQDDLAGLTGLSRKRISQLENNVNVDGLALGNLKKIGGILNVRWFVEPAKVKPPELEV